jgi:hypothetical protein
MCRSHPGRNYKIPAALSKKERSVWYDRMKEREVKKERISLRPFVLKKKRL